DDKALEALGQAAMLASAAERRAMDVEREVVDLHRALLMKQHIGEHYEGTVTALVGSGLFVALDSPYVDVLVKLEALGSDPFQLDDDGLRVVARRSGEIITLGDRMVVRVDEVSIERRTVLARRLRSLASKLEDEAGDDHRRDGRAPPRRLKSKVGAKKGATEARTPGRDPTGKKQAAGKATSIARRAAKEQRRKQRDESAPPAKAGAKKSKHRR
ncbi:MAG: S1 RNA-binding domain-containing protein, partial [Polyangiales bacterium]